MGRVVEVDEEQLLSDQKLRATVGRLMANPKAKLLIQEAAKVVDPTANTPELDAVRAAGEKLDPVSKELSELRKEMAEEKANREARERLQALNAQHEAGFSRLRQQGWTDKGIEEVRKIMEEKGILDHDIAAAYHEKLHPPQNLVTPNGSGGWNFMDQVSADTDADLKKLIETKGDSIPLIDKMARDALTEHRNQSRR